MASDLSNEIGSLKIDAKESSVSTTSARRYYQTSHHQRHHLHSKRAATLDPDTNEEKLRIVVLGATKVGREYTTILLKKRTTYTKDNHFLFFLPFFLLCARQGKTCLCQQFLQEKFLIEHKETVDEMHSVELSLVDRRIILEILDTAGIDEFPVMRRIAISHGDAFLILYAVNDAHSFEIARQMYELVREIKADAIHTIPLVIVANKCDIELDKYEITREYADMIVRQQWQIPLVETTCHQRESVLNTFRVLLQLANITTTFGSDVTRRSSDPSLVSNRGHRSTSKRQSCTQQ